MSVIGQPWEDELEEAILSYLRESGLLYRLDRAKADRDRWRAEAERLRAELDWGTS